VHLHLSFIDLAEEHSSEVKRPDTIVRLLQPNLVLLECVGEEEKPILEADRPGIGHPLHEEVSGILQWRKTLGVLVPRVRVARRWRISGERGVRPLLVVLLSECTEGSLLLL
jgi:hypothetical protein